jgi:hypothetical protein
VTAFTNSHAAVLRQLGVDLVRFEA